MSNMPWFRFYSETHSDLKFTRIARELQLDKPQVIGAWTIILCLANQSPVRGNLYVTLQKRFTIEDVTDALGWEPQITEMLVSQFIDLGMIHLENDAYCITNWSKRQYAGDSSAERVRKHREMKRCSNVTVTLPSVSLSDSDSDSLSTLRDEVIKLTGLQVLQGDIKTLIEWDKEQVTEDDIRDALQWRKDQGLQPVKTISQLAGGVATSRSRRIQDQSAKKNGKQPDKNYPDYTAA